MKMYLLYVEALRSIGLWATRSIGINERRVYSVLVYYISGEKKKRVNSFWLVYVLFTYTNNLELSFFHYNKRLYY